MGDQIEVTWKSFMLRPEPKTRTMEKFIEYTDSWAVPNQYEDSITYNRWSGEHEQPSHSTPALAAGKLAEQYGTDAARQFHHRVLYAYFTENRTVSDTDVLAELAGDAGLDSAEFKSQFAEQYNSLAELVYADHNEAIGAGINAVPTVVLGGRLAVPGVQDADTYERLCTRLIAKANET